MVTAMLVCCEVTETSQWGSSHTQTAFCSQPRVLTCHPGLKLIRILSEGKLKRGSDALSILPFIWCQEIHLDVFCTAHITTKTRRRSCLYLSPTTQTTSSPSTSCSHHLMQKCPSLLKCHYIVLSLAVQKIATMHANHCVHRRRPTPTAQTNNKEFLFQN